MASTPYGLIAVASTTNPTSRISIVPIVAPLTLPCISAPIGSFAVPILRQEAGVDHSHHHHSRAYRWGVRAAVRLWPHPPVVVNRGRLLVSRTAVRSARPRLAGGVSGETSADARAVGRVCALVRDGSANAVLMERMLSPLARRAPWAGRHRAWCGLGGFIRRGRRAAGATSLSPFPLRTVMTAGTVRCPRHVIRHAEGVGEIAGSELAPLEQCVP